MPNPVTFSPKQRRAITWWVPGSPYERREAVICDGAVRSGKTLCLGLGFFTWAMFSFAGRDFGLCGKTIAGVRRNLLLPLYPLLRGAGFTCVERLAQNRVDVTFCGRTNRFLLFGGRDEGSAALIQGVTLSGVLLDEAALMPRSFVEQALARCSEEGSRFWFSCNPQHPSHWFYREWIEKAKEKKTLYLHFTMADNPVLSQRMRERYAAIYAGVFRERFVEGRWVAGQGLVYPMFSPARHVAARLPGAMERFVISCDYGTVNPMSMGLWGLCGGVWYRVREYYHDSRTAGVQKTDGEYYKALERLAGKRCIDAVVVDPSAASFIQCVRAAGKYRCIPAKNEVRAGIAAVARLLSEGGLKIHRSCADALREFTLYRWDEAPGRDAPVKEHDHAMDDIRYFALTIAARPGKSAFAAGKAERGTR